MSKGGAVAFYARVSSEAQARAHTIDSQVAALKERIAADGFQLEPDHGYVDDGCGGRGPPCAVDLCMGWPRSIELARGAPTVAANGLQKSARSAALERHDDPRDARKSGLYRTCRARTVAHCAGRTAAALDPA